MQAIAGPAGWTPFDWAILGVLVVSVVAAFVHGFLVEVFALAGLVVGVIAAGQFYDQLTPWVGQFIHDRFAAQAAAFLLIALGIMLLAAIIARLLRWILRRVGLGWADRLAGGAFGLVKGYVLVALGVAAIAAFFPQLGWLERSQLVPYFMPGAHGSATVLPRELSGRIQSGLEHLRVEARRSVTGLERP